MGTGRNGSGLTSAPLPGRKNTKIEEVPNINKKSRLFLNVVGGSIEIHNSETI
jgi:hypothetical protein